jgi:hypothetical protein
MHAVELHIDRRQAAHAIKSQIRRAAEWRQQTFTAIEQERTAKIEGIQRTAFEKILARLKGATSMQRLKVWCEGPTDVPMFKALLAQIPEMPDVLFDFVGGWPHLIAKDQQTFEHGCKEAFVVLERYGMVDEYLKDTALRRADEFDNDVAAASKSQPTRLHGDLAVTSAVGEGAIEVPNSHATPTNKHRTNAVVAFCSLSLNVLKNSLA